ncbi:MAG: GTP cyclohydrolase I [Candidatus Kapaibacterium sp.]
MSEELLPANRNSGSDIDKINDLSDDELDEEFGDAVNGFPEFNQFGKKLFDANGNLNLSEEERKDMIYKLAGKFTEIMEILRISRNDPNSTHTPMRIARMYVNELFSGRFTEPPRPTVFPNRKNVNNLIISHGIRIMSVCSHHWQPISGNCVIGYIPGDYVIGLSKLTRVVEWFSHRGQIQEELGEQIADYLEKLLKPKALGVVIRAKHYCMIARGVRSNENDSIMTTSVVRGYLMDDLNLRNEFMSLIEK